MLLIFVFCVKNKNKANSIQQSAQCDIVSENNNFLNKGDEGIIEEITDPETLKQRLIERAQTPENIKRQKEIENMTAEERRELTDKLTK